MGKISASHSKSKSTTTPNAPAWATPQVQSLTTNTANLANQDPYSFVAGPDALQTQAATGASALTQPNASTDALTRLTSQQSQSDPYTVATVKPNSILPNLDAYISPYLNDVVNKSLASYDYGAGQTRGANALARASSDTFGGSGGDLQTALSNSKMALDRGTLASGLLDQGFGVGAGLASEDANRRQQAQLANMDAFNTARQFGVTQAHSAANDLQTNERANLGTQMDMGSILQALEQAKAGAPLTVQQAINAAYGSLQPSVNNLTGQTQKGTNTSFGAQASWSAKGGLGG